MARFSARSSIQREIREIDARLLGLVEEMQTLRERRKVLVTASDGLDGLVRSQAPMGTVSDAIKKLLDEAGAGGIAVNEASDENDLKRGTVRATLDKWERESKVEKVPHITPKRYRWPTNAT